MTPRVQPLKAVVDLLLKRSRSPKLGYLRPDALSCHLDDVEVMEAMIHADRYIVEPYTLRCSIGIAIPLLLNPAVDLEPRTSRL